VAIIASQFAYQQEQSALLLLDYVHHIGYDECAFFGVATFDPEVYGESCPVIWTKDARDRLARYLWEAQIELERFLGFPLGRKWYTNEVHLCDRNPILTKWGRVIAGGSKSSTLIEEDVPLVYADGLATATITMDLPVYPLDEIVIYHANTQVPIIPSSIEYIGGEIVITIPPCRAVQPQYQNNPDTGWTLEEDVFAEEVDVWRVYNDTENQGSYVCKNGCPGTEELHDLCVDVEDGSIGRVSIYHMDTYCSACRSRQYLRLNYLAGYELAPDEREAIIRLAHSNIPSALCGCGVFEGAWSNDFKTPETFTMSRERFNCPFGMSNGAWKAYRWALEARLIRMYPSYAATI